MLFVQPSGTSRPSVRELIAGVQASKIPVSSWAVTYPPPGDFSVG
jgi:hypothetical protein